MSGRTAEPDRQIDRRDQQTIRRIAKVNHAGEHGAIRIYATQIAVARWLMPDVVPKLAEMLEHERAHCASFAECMPKRNARPCGMLFLWSIGGRGLGLVTAMLGRNGIWACTAAVEEAVHHHLDDQLRFLARRDPELFAVIDAIRAEELSHLEHAEHSLTSRGPVVRLLRLAIAAVTDFLILASTSGDSLRLSRQLKSSAI